MSRPDLELIAKNITEISTIPAIAAKLMSVLGDPKSSARDLEMIIQRDPGLTVRVLRMVNSPYFGLKEPVSEVRRAVVFLGNQRLREIAVTSTVCELFQKDSPVLSYNRSQLWKHSTAVAMACSMIARRIDQKLHESMFSLGILHDVGIILMDQYVHEPFIEVLTQFDPKKDNLEILENEIIGFDHQKLAYTVMKDWGLPKEFLSTVANHHSPSSETDFPVVVSIVFLANALCNAANCGFVEGRRVNPNDFKTALDTLKLSKEDVQVLVEDLPHELERIDEFLGIL